MQNVFSLLHLAYLDSEADEAVRQYETDPEFRQQVDRVVNRMVEQHSSTGSTPLA